MKKADPAGITSPEPKRTRDETVSDNGECHALSPADQSAWLISDRRGALSHVQDVCWGRPGRLARPVAHRSVGHGEPSDGAEGNSRRRGPVHRSAGGDQVRFNPIATSCVWTRTSTMPIAANPEVSDGPDGWNDTRSGGVAATVAAIIAPHVSKTCSSPDGPETGSTKIVRGGPPGRRRCQPNGTWVVVDGLAGPSWPA